MQRWISKLGHSLVSSSHRRHSPFSSTQLNAGPLSSVGSASSSVVPCLPISRSGFQPHSSPFFLVQVLQSRHFAAKERSRAPDTPVTSKLKKYKLKAYSSFKFRFRTMNDGQIRRWRAGKRHNAHLKSKKSKRRLRKPEVVHAAYAKVMKKLNFAG
ncbi:hypothetical protein AXF42_Ash018630 [Apostasia shenzhenica]|uniref:50S ribosomal protein L35 n=1 Tax=Apostasia shenzhenica TaxID=1088818 RepID=A0A2I0B1I1_9ASPA|nr:hypothetical protein AXF42_Ash018630 [Apostasia shenzhenica]